MKKLKFKGYHLKNFGMRVDSSKLNTTFTITREINGHIIFNHKGEFQDRLLPKEYEKFYSMFISKKLENRSFN